MKNLLQVIQSVDENNKIQEAPMSPIKPTPIPKLLHFFWAGGAKPMPDVNIETVTAWAEKNPDFKTIVWVDVKTTPPSVFKDYLNKEPPKGFKGTNVVIADVNSNGIIPPESQDDFTYNSPQRLLINALRPNYGGSSDILRYLVLHQFGGAYFDSDIMPGVKQLNHEKIFDKSEGPVLLLNPTTQNILAAGNDSFICTPGHPRMKAIANTAISNYTKQFYRDDYSYHRPTTYFNLENKMQDTVTRTGPVAVRRTFLEHNELGRNEKITKKKYPFGGTVFTYEFDNKNATLATHLEVPSKYWMSDEVSQALPENQNNWLIPLVQAMPREEALNTALKEVLFEANNQGIMRLDDHIEDVAISMSLNEINKKIATGNHYDLVGEFKIFDLSGHMLTKQQLEVIIKLRDRSPISNELANAIRKLNNEDKLTIEDNKILIEFLTNSSAVKEIFGGNTEEIINKFLQKKFTGEEYNQLQQAITSEGLTKEDLVTINSIISRTTQPNISNALIKMVTSLSKRDFLEQEQRDLLNKYVCVEKLAKKMPLNYLEKYTLAQIMSHHHTDKIAEDMVKSINTLIKYDILKKDNVDYAQLMSRHSCVRQFYFNNIPHAFDDQTNIQFVFETISKQLPPNEAAMMALEYIEFLNNHIENRYNYLRKLLTTESFKNTEENRQLLDAIKNNIVDSSDKQKEVYLELEKHFEKMVSRLNESLSIELIFDKKDADTIKEQLTYILKQLPEMTVFASSEFMDSFIKQLMQTLNKPLSEQDLLLQLAHAQNIVNRVCNFTTSGPTAGDLMKKWPAIKGDPLFDIPDTLHVNIANIILSRYKMINCQSLINQHDGLFSEKNKKFTVKEDMSFFDSKDSKSSKKDTGSKPQKSTELDITKIMEQLGWNTRVKANKFSSFSRYGDDSADINIDNQREDENYLLQAHDINYVGDLLLRGDIRFLKTYLLPVQQSHLNIAAADIERALQENAKEKILAGQDVVSIFNKNANHWVAFKISRTNDGEITVLYKDSYGAKYPDEFAEIIHNTFPKFKVRFIYSNSKEQNDSVSCGVFALQNMVALARIDSKDVLVTSEKDDELCSTFQNNDMFYQPGVNNQLNLVQQRSQFGDLFLKRSEEMRLDAKEKKLAIEKEDKLIAEPLVQVFSDNKNYGKVIQEKMVRGSFSIGFRSLPDSKEILLNINLKNDLVGKHNGLIKLLKLHDIKYEIQDEPRQTCRHIIISKGEAIKLLQILKKDSSQLDECLGEFAKQGPIATPPYKEFQSSFNTPNFSSKPTLRFQSLLNSREDSLDINIFNQQKDPTYQLQSHDINYIADKLFAGQKNTFFLPVQQNHLRVGAIGLKIALETTAKDKIENGQDVISIFNKSANHWVCYKITKTNQGELTVLYKDSKGDKYPDEFAKLVAQAFPDYKINFVYSNTKQQEDGVSCGIFALRNLEQLLKISNDNIVNSYQNKDRDLIFNNDVPFYNPGIGKEGDLVLFKERGVMGALYSSRSNEVEKEVLLKKKVIEQLDSNVTDIILSTLMSNDKLSDWIVKQNKDNSFSMGFRLLPDSMQGCLNINFKNGALLQKGHFEKFLDHYKIPYQYAVEPKGDCGHIIIQEKDAKKFLGMLGSDKQMLNMLSESLNPSQNISNRKL